jgi:hypothetical protein
MLDNRICSILGLVGPEHSSDQRAKFLHKNKEYYVYLNPYATICPGINMGSPEDLPLTIMEVIEIYQNPERKQTYSTSSLGKRKFFR